MNIQVQICGMLILILLCVFYKSHKTLQLYTEKVFYKTMIAAVINLILDIVSLVAIQFRNLLPMILVDAVCKLYLVSLIWEAMFALSYIMTDLFTQKKHQYWFKKVNIISLIESIIVLLLPIHIYEDVNQSYTYGTAVVCVYAFVILYFGAIIVTLTMFYRRINSRRAFAVAIWMMVWVSAAIIQFLNNALLIVGFANAIGILILFVIMENPEANIDRKLACFNSYALLEYIKQMMEIKQQFSVLELSFENWNGSEEMKANDDRILREILSSIERYRDVLVFKNMSSDIVLVSKEAECLKDVGKELLNAFFWSDLSAKEVSAVLVVQGMEFINVDDLFGFLAFARSKYADTQNKIFIADEEVVRKYKERYDIEQEIADALIENRVEVFLQPIFSNEENRFTSAEALLRIRQKDGKLLSPGVFIPIAEESGQILELGERVVERVCDFLKNTEAIRLGIHYIEVNLSVIQCEMHDLADRLIAIVEEYKVNPKYINLEITETASISARNTLLKNMEKLIEYGFTFSLDDFGKGESNLMYVVEMPVSIVKLDYDMSKAFFNVPKAKHVVRAVVNMAHGMNLKLVAEGIENKDEIDGMCKEGIDYIQGYYYAKPMPMQEFLQFIIENQSKQIQSQ